MRDQVIAKALAQVLSLSGGDWFTDAPAELTHSRVIHDWGMNIWRLWESGDQSFFGEAAIVWNAREDSAGIGNVNLGAFLCPLSWAVCALKAGADSRITVLDLMPSAHFKQSPLHRLVGAMRTEQMPWLRLVTVDELGNFLGERFTCAEKNADSVSESVNHKAEMLESLCLQMREELTREGGQNDRHAIQNIVGPLALLGREYLAKKGVAERALLQVFEATGLMSERLAEGNPPGSSSKEGSWGDKPRRLLLVDDQADCGWADWVRSTLPTAKPNLVTLDDSDVITRPEVLLDRLDAELKLLGNAADRRFELQLLGETPPKKPNTNFPQDRQPVLFLDLRLHSMRSIDDEKAFFERLLPLCERLKTGGEGSPFAWPGFSPQELQDVRSWCEQPKRETDKHFLGLSLLPRLLALLDMSLPIIVFSSTGQRSIIEKFKPYGNIITDFEKPRFFGRDVGNVVIETQGKLAEAVERATKVLTARSACTCVSLGKRVTPTIGVSRKAKVAHLFVDESGNLETSDYFSIGAFIVMADSQDKLNEFSSEIEKIHRWGFSCSNYVPPSRTDWSNESRWNESVLRQIPTDYLAKNKPEQWSWNQYREMMNNVLGDINHRLTSSGFQWAAAAFHYRIDDRNTYDSGTGGLDSIFDHDMLFRKGLRDLLRFVVADYPVVGEFLKRPDTVFSVDVASRELRANKFSETQYREDMENRFAARFRRTRDGYALMTMNGYDVFPLVASLFTDLKIPLSRLDKARAVILHDYQSVSQYPARMRVPESLPLQIHYLADWLAKCACWRDSDRPKKVKSWFERGFIQERTQNFDELWSVVSQGKRGLVTDAVQKIRHLRLAGEQELSSGVSAERYLRESASEWPKTLAGNEFRTLTGRL